MDSVLKFECHDVDLVSGISTQHLTFLIQQLIPERVIGKERYEGYCKAVSEDEGFKQDKECGILVIPTGSKSEGFNLPIMANIKSSENLHIEDNTDTDYMRVEEKYQVTFSFELFSFGGMWALVETDGMHPGYAKLNESKDSANPNYKSRENIQLRLKKMQTEKLNLSPDDIEINGPAITIVETKEVEPIKMASYVYRKTRISSVDYVLALPCKEWPHTAVEWIRRQKAAKWIEPDMIESLVKDGCHIVPAAHRLSRSQDEQWRISFAATEGRIAREVITDKQRQAYVLIKILYYHKLKQHEILTSYQLKNVFFYACETVPKSFWDKNVGACVFHILDQAIEFVKRKNIPSFFIPENNLIDYFDDAQQGIILDALQSVRVNIVDNLMDFTDGRIVVPAGCKQLSFREMCRPIVEDMKSYAEHRNLKQSVLEAFIPVSTKNLAQHMHENKQEEAVHIAEDLYALVVEHNLTEYTFEEFCFWNIAYTFSAVDKSVDFLEKYIEMYRDAGDVDAIRNNIPALYHAASYRYPLGSDANNKYIAKAEEAFKSKLDRVRETKGGDCDFVLFLIKQNRGCEAIKELKQIIGKNNLDVANVYSAPELMTLDDVLQMEVIEHNSFSAPSVSLAYYLLIDVLFDQEKGRTAETVSLLQRFKTHAKEVNLPRTYALYGYSCMLLSEWSLGAEAFDIAFNGNKGADYIRALKMKRYCEKKVAERIQQVE